jgi:hypothetical protein
MGQAVIVLGAGATRGCSFANPAVFPCLPPLDGDFFTQLQRVRNKKHQTLIQEVLEDVVELFGYNFDATMETVFTTLEHTIRLLEATGKQFRNFDLGDLRAKRERLIQAVAVVLEESLTKADSHGGSSREPNSCDNHEGLVKHVLRRGDAVVSFNYDCLIDYALRENGSEKWNPRYGYGFKLGSQGSLLTGDKHWAPRDPSTSNDTIKLLKLHGSLHFDIGGTDDRPRIKLKQRPYTRQKGNLKFTIIPPEWHKTYDKGAFRTLWQRAVQAISQAEHLVFIGYSLPPTDLHATALFRTSVRSDKLKSLVIINPDREARRRTRAVVQRGLSGKSRVLSFDRFEHFLALDASAWRGGSAVASDPPVPLQSLTVTSGGESDPDTTA